jgi:hypothetical protein
MHNKYNGKQELVEAHNDSGAIFFLGQNARKANYGSQLHIVV